MYDNEEFQIDITQFLWGLVSGVLCTTVVATLLAMGTYVYKPVIIKAFNVCEPNGGLRRISTFNTIHCRNGVVIK